MDRGLKNFLIISLCIVVLLIGLGGPVINNFTKGLSFISDKRNFTEKLTKETSVQIGSASDIHIEADLAGINIYSENRKDIKVILNVRESFAPTISKDMLTVNNESGRINIILKDDFKIFKSSNVKLDIYIPENYNKNIEIKNAAGYANLKNMTLNNLDIETAAGKLVLDDSTINMLNAACTTGSIEINNTDTGTTNAKITAGSLKLNNFSGDLDGKVTTGSLNVEYKEFNNNIKVKATTGSVIIKLPEKSEFNLNAHTSAGKISCSLPINVKESSKSNLTGYVGSSENNIDLEVTAGNILIK